MSKLKGSFTLPGESGYEKLTLQLAEKWGADVIRDSDGTVLSDEILNAGYGIYSTICIIRDHNEWAKKNPDKLQQCFLMTEPIVAESNTLEIELMRDFFSEQFRINETWDSIKYWQVWDRTSNTEIPRENWNYLNGKVMIKNIAPFHKYTVSFLAWRIWEEISMYNHTTNNWDKEHLMQIDPVYPETQEYLLEWMENWCKAHPATTVVRFTSMFYNFVWIWGSDERNRHKFTDWASYDFTVSPKMLDDFAKKYGYSLTAEDFINKGKLHATHISCDRKKLDWMEFVSDFVVSFGKKLVDIVHKYGKLAYVFYDDSWVGIEPYGPRFAEFGFDGIIKCVFSGFEARLCSGVQGVKTHELRLHPYLFPVGLGGLPTFMDGGNPTLDAKIYWNNVRRALLRAPIDRIGLGGYLHLVQDFPDFCDYIEKISDEFRTIKQFHKDGKPYVLKPKVAVLSFWGKLRSWTCSGHYHETYMHDLININESLSGMPLDVSFISFDNIKNGVPEDIDIIINAGYEGSAWSGGEIWADERIASALTEWVHKGGAFIGVNEPSALRGFDTLFRMAHVLGVDKDTGERVCHGKWKFKAFDKNGIIAPGSNFAAKENIYLTDGKAEVLLEKDGLPVVSAYSFGKGKGIYFSSYKHSTENAKTLLNAILYASGEPLTQKYIPDNLYVECAYYPESKTLVAINNSNSAQSAGIDTDNGKIKVSLEPYDTQIIRL